MKPPHADPSHVNHAHYNPETDDYPDHEAPFEKQWQYMGGIDVDGKMWLTPRMERNAARLAESLANAMGDSRRAGSPNKQGVTVEGPSDSATPQHQKGN